MVPVRPVPWPKPRRKCGGSSQISCRSEGFLPDTTYNGKTFAVRSNAVGVAGKIAQCVGVRLPNTVRQVDVEKEVTDPSP